MKSRREKYIDKLILILNKGQQNKMTYPSAEIDALENEIGAIMLNDIFQYLKDRDLTNIGCLLCNSNEVHITVGRPFLKSEALDYVDYLQKPFYKRWLIDTLNKGINWNAVGVLVAFLGLIFAFIYNVDKICSNYHQYIKPFILNIFS